ncbi:MAG: hypothetical protein FWG65_12565 [Turicibacter sp.]|nr:hypothetical protein [Turicibacter sp.]
MDRNRWRFYLHFVGADNIRPSITKPPIYCKFAILRADNIRPYGTSKRITNPNFSIID